MGKILLIAVAWVATVALAWMLGANAGDDGGTRRADREAREPAGGMAPAEADDNEAAGRETEAAAKKEAEPEKDTPEPAAPDEKEITFTTEDVETVEELSARFMKFAAQKLAQGPEGHKELFRALNAMIEDKRVRELVRDERQMMPLAYPWLRFAMDREKQIVAMMETLYKTAAEEPQWYEGLDDNPLELFTEGLAVLLPGYATPEQLARFRGYVKEILKHDPQSLPNALKGNLRDFARNLEYWQGPVSPEDALAIVHNASAPPAERLAMLSRVKPSDLRGVELAPILAPSLRAGNGQALRIMGRLPLTARDTPALDAAFMEGVTSGRVVGWTINQYLRSTKRNTWEEAKPFFEQGLARGGKVTEAFAQGLLWPPSKPPKEYIQGVLESYEINDALRAQLKRQYGIE